MIDTLHKTKLKKERFESALPKDDQDLEIIQMTVRKRKKVLKRIDGLSDNAKLLLHMWVLLAKRNLNPDGNYSSLYRILEDTPKESSLFDEVEEPEEESEEDLDAFESFEEDK